MEQKSYTIECPHCHEVFELSNAVKEADYRSILEQVKDQRFENELHEKLTSELERQRLSLEAEKEKVLSEQSKMLAQLQEQLKAQEAQKNAEIELAKSSVRDELAKQVTEKNAEIAKLSAQLENSSVQFELAKNQAVQAVKEERDAYKNKLELQEKDIETKELVIKERFEQEIRGLKDQVDFYKNFKAQQSTKEIGESLERYADIEFNKLRATAFQTAYFGKDNEVSSSGSKGDFIFRDFDEEGLEYISIMFEMKNEADETKTKHKNSDFFKELDKDRNEKGCEYAVLVSMLESDNEYYNVGIVEVLDYPKMYVVRPQFFIQIISLLRNAARNSLQYKRDLEIIRNQNIDITNFEQDLNNFKENFGITAKNFNGNLEKLDKNLEDSIKKLTTARDELRKAMKNLGTAENKLDNLDIKKLTKNNPTMKAKFLEL